MRILCNVTWEKDEETKEGESTTESGMYWLLYFGMDYKIIEVGDGRIAAVNYTIAVCEDYETGQIETFLPTQIKILGITIDKSK